MSVAARVARTKRGSRRFLLFQKRANPRRFSLARISRAATAYIDSISAQLAVMRIATPSFVFPAPEMSAPFPFGVTVMGAP
jgi:hypothetical protein